MSKVVLKWFPNTSVPNPSPDGRALFSDSLNNDHLSIKRPDGTVFDLEALVAPPAWDTGPTGPIGPAGIAGPQGMPWLSGAVWATGPKWDTGYQWPSWPIWPTWDIWPIWLTWDTGPQWDTWVQWPTGPSWGPQWDTWVMWPTGPQWDTGIQWPQWDTWVQWPTGPSGWPQWDTGIQWPQWDTGLMWPTGPQWDTGIQWPTGPSWGPQWDTWATGPVWATWIWTQGPQGLTGPMWPTGPQGPQWPTGVVAISTSWWLIRLSSNVSLTAWVPWAWAWTTIPTAWVYIIWFSVRMRGTQTGTFAFRWWVYTTTWAIGDDKFTIWYNGIEWTKEGSASWTALHYFSWPTPILFYWKVAWGNGTMLATSQANPNFGWATYLWYVRVA